MSVRLLLYPGAGSGADHSSLIAIEDAVRPAQCDRSDFAYRVQGRRAPDRAPRLMAEVRERIGELGSDPLVVGGRSMGGRICSMVAAGTDGVEPPAAVVGLVAVSYPLHPPARPDRLRVEHLSELRVPCLFVSGTRDAFGTPDELTQWTSTIPAPVTHVWIEGGRHDLAGADAEIAAAVAAFVESLDH
jgi:uncharacterized protein